jgi:hypothetical protein
VFALEALDAMSPEPTRASAAPHANTRREVLTGATRRRDRFITPLWFAHIGEVQGRQLESPYLDVRFARRGDIFASSIPCFE